MESPYDGRVPMRPRRLMHLCIVDGAQAKEGEAAEARGSGACSE